MTPQAHAFGPLTVVTPAEFRLPREAWTDLNLAIVANDDGDETGARVLIRRLEDRLGVTDHDRLVAQHGHDVIAGPFCSIDGRSRRRLRKHAARSERGRVTKLIVPEDRLTPGEIKRLDRASQLRLMATDLHRAGNRSQAQAKLVEARDLERGVAVALAGRVERHDRDRGKVEREQMANGRGEKIVTEKAVVFRTTEVGHHRIPVEKPETTDRVRNLSRDGLEMLRRSGGVDSVAYAAVWRYRQLWDDAEPELKAPGTGDGGSTPGSRCPFSERRVQARDQLKRIERRVLRDSGERALSMLRSIGGRGLCISHVARAGSPRRRAGDAFRRAADVLADAWGIH